MCVNIFLSTLLLFFITVKEIFNLFNLICVFSSSTEPSKALDVILVEELKQMVDAHSKYAKKFRQIRDHVERGGSEDFCIRMYFY
jgi:hypothetical protein